MCQPASLLRGISPPPARPRRTCNKNGDAGSKSTAMREPRLAAVEAGEAQVRNHLAYFAKHLGAVTRLAPGPRLSIEQFRELYQRNQHSHGRHFVVHQHDHPISGMTGPWIPIVRTEADKIPRCPL
jgi:hypothetical protein